MLAAAELSPQQLAAADAFNAWFRGATPEVFRLFGPAGTGKTTIAKFLADPATLRIPVIFLAFTGKAALVLRSKGCLSAQTIHSAIYIPKSKCNQRAIELRRLIKELPEPVDADRARELRSELHAEEVNLKRPAFSLNLDSPVRHHGLIVLDEVSMVGHAIAMDLLSFKVPILALGDPFQLPPVGDAGFFTAQRPDFMLTDVHRQAVDSPVLRLATMIRRGEPIPIGQYGDSRIVPKGTLSIHELAAHDQIICGRNATRKIINRRVRSEVYGRVDHLPVGGDRLICLRNDAQVGFLNGSQWECLERQDIDQDRILTTVRSLDDGETLQVQAFRHHFEDREKDIPFYEIKEAQHFDFAYAITCHKSQGSQWPSVAVIDESATFREDATKWKYTACTRASERLTLIS